MVLLLAIWKQSDGSDSIPYLIWKKMGFLGSIGSLEWPLMTPAFTLQAPM